MIKQSKTNQENSFNWIEPIFCLLHENQYPILQQEIYQIAEKEDDAQNLNIEDAHFIFNQLRLKPLWQKVSWRQLSKTELPAILHLKNSEAVVLLSIENSQANVSVVRDGKPSRTRVSLQSLKASYTGEVLTIRSEQEPLNFANRIRISEWINKKTLFYSVLQIIVASLMINIFQLALPLYTMNVYDKVLVHEVEATLWVLFSGIIIILIFDYIFRLTRSIILENISERVGESISMRLLRKSATATTINQQEVGSISDVFHQINNFRVGFFTKTLVEIIEFPFFFLFFFVIWAISPEIAMIPLYAALFVLFVNTIHHFPLKRYGKDQYMQNKKRESFLIQLLSGRETLRLTNGISKFMNKWQGKTVHILGLERASHLWGNSMGISLPIVVQSVSVIVIAVGSYEYFAGNITIGALVASTILSGRAIMPVLNFASAVTRLFSSRPMLKSWKQILNTETDYDLSENIISKTQFKGGLLIKDLSFKYKNSKKFILQNINFSMKEGERLGIVGPSGTGKSTLLRLLTHLEKCDQGNIQLDGFDISQIHPFELYRNISYMPQNPAFFSGTIYDNIRLNNESINQQIFDEMIEEFNFKNLTGGEEPIEGGLSFEVGENGSALSGGQKQLVALIRCLSSNANLYILDEPTSGMDSQLENKVINYISKRFAGKSMIVVTHRPNLLAMVENLLIINQGKVFEKGPKDLMIQKYFKTATDGRTISEVPLRQAKVM